MTVVHYQPIVQSHAAKRAIGRLADHLSDNKESVLIMTKQQRYDEKMRGLGLVVARVWLLPKTKAKVLQLQAEDKKKAAGAAK